MGILASACGLIPSKNADIVRKLFTALRIYAKSSERTDNSSRGCHMHHLRSTIHLDALDRGG